MNGMLPRFVLVAGMAIGVMALLIWAAYVSVPASRSASPIERQIVVSPESTKAKSDGDDVPSERIGEPRLDDKAQPRERVKPVDDVYVGPHIITVPSK